MKRHIVAVLWFAALFAASCASAPSPEPQEFQELPEALEADGGVQDDSADDAGASADDFEDPQDSEDGFSAVSDGEGQPEPASGADSGVSDAGAPEDPPADGEPDSPGNGSALDAEEGAAGIQPQDPELQDVLPADGGAVAADAPVSVSIAPPSADSAERSDSEADGTAAGGSEAASDLEEKVVADELPPLPEDGADGAAASPAAPVPVPAEFVEDDFSADFDDEYVPPLEPPASDDGGTEVFVSERPELPADDGPVPEPPDVPDAPGRDAGSAVPSVIPEAPRRTSPEKAPPSPSRSMTVKRNQLIEVVYPGKGWIYQGCIDSGGNIDSRNRNFIFGGRKLGGTNQSFTLRARQPGTYLLHFYKNDALSGEYIDDYLEVVVGEEQAASGEQAVAPDYAEIVPPKSTITAEALKAARPEADAPADGRVSAEKSEEGGAPAGLQGTADSPSSFGESGASARDEESGGTQPRLVPEDASIKTVIQTTESAPDSSAPSVRGNSGRTVQPERNPAQESGDAAPDGAAFERPEADAMESGDDLLDLARRQYDAGEYAAALKTVAQFFDKAVSRIDEGLYLQGQILEERSDVQNIKGAIDSYDLLVRNWPASALWDDANRRSIFLKRFYINIR